MIINAPVVVWVFVVVLVTTVVVTLYPRYRKNGIHQLSEAEQYEAQRVRRNR